MKILYYSPHPNLSMGASTGYATHIREMIAAFEALGHTVHPVIRGGNAATVPGTISTATSAKSVLKKIMPRYCWRSLKEYALMRFDRHSATELEKEVDAFKPDLIYERSAYLCNSGSLIAAKKNIPHFVEVNAPFEEEVRDFEKAGSVFDGKGKKRLKEVLQKSKQLVVVSSALRDYYSSRYEIPADKILITPNAINPDQLFSNEELLKKLQTKYRKEHTRIIGFVGSVFPYHGVDLLVQAFAQIYTGNKNALLLIVGDGYLIPELQEMAKQLGCADAVVFIGSVPHKEVFTYIQLMDIAVMARSNWYGSPVKIFEYGAMRKPIIAPDTIPVRDVMKDGQDGLLIRPELNELKSALEKMMNDPAAAKQMAERFAAAVFEKHSWKRMAETILERLNKPAK